MGWSCFLILEAEVVLEFPGRDLFLVVVPFAPFIAKEELENVFAQDVGDEVGFFHFP